METSKEQVIILVSSITLVFLIIGIFMLLYVHLHNQRKKRHEEVKKKNAELERQLLQSQVEVQESTRAELGKELHDNVGQLLSTTKMLLGITERNLEKVPDTLSTAHNTLAKAIDELRSLSKSLDKEWLEQFRLDEHLQNDIKRINTGGEVKAYVQGKLEQKLDANTQIILYRVVQEAVQNSIKHSEATEIMVCIVENEASIQLKVEDNGKGIKEIGMPEGQGLKNMTSRIRSLGGEIRWLSNNGKGTIVVIELPIKISL